MNTSIKNLKIVFLGTPEFAVASLKALVENGFNVVGVVTAPDKPAGRGQQLHESDVKKYALSQGLPIAQPEKLRDPAFIKQLKAWNADLQVVVAFRMLPEIVWNMPPMGTINVHASLLPQYRGAAPINWALINGEEVTGVTTFLLQHVIDTGNILLQDTVNIEAEDNIGTLYEKLMHKGSALLIRTIQELIAGNIQPQAQEESPNLRHAPKIFKEDGLIDWTQTAASIHNRIRGLSPIPGAYTHLNGKLFKIYESSIITNEPASKPGSIFTDNKTYLHFQAQDHRINCKLVQLEGKKRMPIADFLRGVQVQTS